MFIQISGSTVITLPHSSTASATVINLLHVLVHFNCFQQRFDSQLIRIHIRFYVPATSRAAGDDITQ